MRRSRKLCQRESNSDNVFLVDEGREDQNSTKSGPSSSLDFQGIRTRIAKKPFILVIFQEEGSDKLSPTLDPCMKLKQQIPLN